MRQKEGQKAGIHCSLLQKHSQAEHTSEIHWWLFLVVLQYGYGSR